MARRAEFSAQTLLVLAALCAEPREWRHGDGIAKDTRLKSGSLYPILIRLADRGLVEARWGERRPAGRPPRHLYRLTPHGQRPAHAAVPGRPGCGPGGGGGAGLRRGRWGGRTDTCADGFAAAIGAAGAARAAAVGRGCGSRGWSGSSGVAAGVLAGRRVVAGGEGGHGD